MKCHNSNQKIFELKDMIIGIDYGTNTDKAIQVNFIRGRDGRLTVVGIKELKKE